MTHLLVNALQLSAVAPAALRSQSASQSATPKQ